MRARRHGLPPAAGGKGERDLAMNVWKIAPIVLIVLGVLDIIYGVFMSDWISLVAGTALIVIAVLIILRERKREAGGQ